MAFYYLNSAAGSRHKHRPLSISSQRNLRAGSAVGFLSTSPYRRTLPAAPTADFPRSVLPGILLEPSGNPESWSLNENGSLLPPVVKIKDKTWNQLTQFIFLLHQKYIGQLEQVLNKKIIILYEHMCFHFGGMNLYAYTLSCSRCL